MKFLDCLRWAGARTLLGLLALLIGLVWLLRLATAAPDPNQGPGGPILVITSAASPYGTYYAEILRTEGLNEFAVADISTVTPAVLAAYDVAVLAKMPLSGSQVSMLTSWVTGGGNLIAMGPDPQLAGLLGLTLSGPALSDGYLRVDPATKAGNGIVDQTIQFHGSADRYALNGAASIATLYADAVAPTASPAVSLHAIGAGQAAAFTYDLATSIVYTRQGNPAWEAQERDGYAPIRSNDKFFGNAAGDPRPDWVDPNKVTIPQADEQQRLLANLIVHMNLAKKPLPRFWYFPRGKKAVVIMTGDDHANGGTAARFDQFKAMSPPGCSVENWECVRGTSYLYTDTPLSDAQAVSYTAEGFEVGLHINTSCADYTAASLDATYVQQIAQWRAKYPSVPAPQTERHHCIVWSDWVSAAQVQLRQGIRLDTSYYHWPPSWARNVPGLFTGSAMPMRFAGLDGSVLDVYNAATQLTDESGQDYPFTIDTLLDRALGPTGYYGAYVVNAHTDLADSVESDAVVASARARGVPVVSSRQMLDWLDARNASSFGSLAWSDGILRFTVAPGLGANGLQAMVPARSAGGVISTLTRDGRAVNFEIITVKGIEYASFLAGAGAYAATYVSDGSVPTVVSTSPANGAANVAVSSAVTATFNKSIDPATITAATFELRDAADVPVAASVVYDATTRTATLTPSTALAAATRFTAVLKGGGADPRVKDASGNALAAAVTWSFTTAEPFACPCGGWDGAARPSNPSIADPNAVELGVKFTSEVSGFVTGVRFYKGTGNTGTHTGSLWSSTGQLLARATFTNETASGWQQVDFDTPVPIAANTIYVASYFAPNGHYAGDNFFFAARSIDRAPLHMPMDGPAGGNGVYAYGAGGGFPSSTYQATNYWVDVVFSTGTAPDTAPPTVTAVSPANGTTGVSTASAAVTVTFSEAMNAASIDGSTIELRDAANTPVAASVTYNAGTRTATLKPNGALALATTYAATVRGGPNDPRVKDSAGNALAADAAWSFTTAAAEPTCPCSLWDQSAVPTVLADPDNVPVELGVRFQSDRAGRITGLRFYKSGTNTGPHVASLWSNTGQLLARANFTSETATGWQQVDFGTPVPIAANTSYVASYHTSVGQYSQDGGYFAGARSNPPLHALRDGEDGPNGLYRYSATPTFPAETFQSANYWVDVVFMPTN